MVRTIGTWKNLNGRNCDKYGDRDFFSGHKNGKSAFAPAEKNKKKKEKKNDNGTQLHLLVQREVPATV